MKHLIVNHHRPVTLWCGMYVITAGIITAETGNVVTGLTLGLVSASLKTVWTIVHAKLFGGKPCKRCLVLEEEFYEG